MFAESPAERPGFFHFTKLLRAKIGAAYGSCHCHSIAAT
jgi:hypothetical protein